MTLAEKITPTNLLKLMTLFADVAVVMVVIVRVRPRHLMNSVNGGC